jgi:hypothetical protein
MTLGCEAFVQDLPSRVTVFLTAVIAAATVAYQQAANRPSFYENVERMLSAVESIALIVKMAPNSPILCP